MPLLTVKAVWKSSFRYITVDEQLSTRAQNPPGIDVRVALPPSPMNTKYRPEPAQPMEANFKVRVEIADLLDSMREAFVAVDAQWRVTCWNSQAELIYGVRREEILGKNLWDSFPDAVGTVFYHEYHRAMKERVPIQMEAPYVPRRAWFEISIYPVQSGGLVFYFRDISGERTSSTLLAGQNKALEMNVRDADLPAILMVLAETIESLASHPVMASVSLLDSDSLHLRHVAAPSLPEGYVRGIDGLEIGPAVGSCGTAAYTGRSVAVSDILNDPLWDAFRQQAEEFGLRSCWSAPIISSKGSVLGTFAIYSRDIGLPDTRECEAVSLLSRTAALLIEREREREERQAGERALQQARAEAELERGRLRDLLMQAPSAIGITTGPEHRWTYVNHARVKMAGRKSVDDFLGKTVRETYPELDGQPFFEFLDQVYRTGVAWEGKEVKAVFHRGEDGVPSEAYVNFVYQPIRNLAGETEGLLIHTIEVTEQVLARRASQQAHDELELRISERTAELERAQTSLRTLSARLLQAQDDERRHLARELHDSVGQLLVAISMNDAQVQNEVQKLSPRAAEAVKENAGMVSQMAREIRTLSYLLHPPLLDETGLWSALDWFVEGFSQRSKIKTKLDLPRDFGRLDSELETAIFRIVQEALTNIHRHSASPTALISLSRSQGEVRVEVSDAGKGFPAGRQVNLNLAKAGVGIRGMQERVRQFAGTLEIGSNDKGTRLVARFPLANRSVESSGDTYSSVSPSPSVN